MKLRTLILPVAVLAIGTLLWAAIPLEGDPPKVGDQAPDFTLVSNEEAEVTLSDLAGQWVVLYFYPKDFTSGCTIQANKFQRDLTQYEERNAVILGVSIDDVETHQEFCAKEGLSFRLLADTGGNVSEKYGSVRGVGQARLSARNTFLIDPEGKVAEVYMGVNVHKHSEEVLAALDRIGAERG